MIYLILLYIIGCLLIALYQTNKDKKIYYSNYKNCLLALSEYDKSLAEYLSKEGEL